MKILIIVPAYNEEKNIEPVIKDLLKYREKYDILIVNDGSQDLTSEKAKRYKEVTVIDLPLNLGIGGAVQTGFKYARDNGYDIAVQFDGDQQHKASEIKKLLKPIFCDHADVVIGSRFCGRLKKYKSTFFRRLGMLVFRLVNSVLIGQRITDNTSGFRSFNREALVFLSKSYPVDYPEPEAVILLGKNKFRLLEVYTDMDVRKEHNSTIYGLGSIYYMIKVLLAVFVTFLRPRTR